jgi:hypothetical protein
MTGRIDVFRDCNSICIDSSAYAEAFFNLIGRAGQMALDCAIRRLRRWAVFEIIWIMVSLKTIGKSYSISAFAFAGFMFLLILIKEAIYQLRSYVSLSSCLSG